jgi:long-subunit acyl-CoA synthetase (AMP-forming)
VRWSSDRVELSFTIADLPDNGATVSTIEERAVARRGDVEADEGLAADATTLCEAFQRTARVHADAPALRRIGDQAPISWGEYAARVEQLARALTTVGVRRGDTVAILLSGRLETHWIDMACVHLGAVPFNLYPTSTAEQLEYLIGHAGARTVFVEAELGPTLSAALELLPAVENVFALDDDVSGMRSFEELVAIAAPPGYDFATSWGNVQPEDVVTLIYTSGTTGPPKGVEVTHANVLGTWHGYHQVVPYAVRGNLISYLPMAHLADRMSAHYPAIVTGSCVTSVADPKQVGEALRDARPTLFAGVPRVWEKMKAALEASFAARDEQGREEIAGALESGLRRARLELDGQRVPEELEAACRQADADQFAPLRALLGLDEARALISGAAPIAPEVLEFFLAIGLPILEVWGQTETSAAGTANRPGAMRIGTVGQPLPGSEVRLASDGELLVRGPGVMRGYRDDPTKTAETLDPGGWIHTGDVGTMDADGFVRIVDRKKELIINSMGKNMSPVNIETAIKAACPLVGLAVAVGDRRPYVTALLVLDPDAAGTFARRHNIDHASLAELAADQRILAAVEDGVREANERLSRVEQVKRFKLLGDEWLPSGDELTPTMKLKRKPIAEKYAAEIDLLYANRHA